MSNSNLTLHDLAALINSIKTELSTQIKDMHLMLEEKFSKEITKVKNDINNIINRQAHMEEKLEKFDRQMHLTDMLIHGKPMSQDEDLNRIVNSICNIIGFTSMDYALLSIFRINLKSKYPPIILKFISFPARNEFHNLFLETLKNKRLLLSDIGFNSSKPIVVQESLSSHNASIFRKSMELKSNDLLFGVHTKNGFVKIKKSSNEKAIIVYSMQQLDDIVALGVKIVRNKRKFNNSTKSNSSILENDPKMLKSNAQFNVHNSTMVNDSTNSTMGTPATIIENPHRKMSSGTLDEFIIRN